MRLAVDKSRRVGRWMALGVILLLSVGCASPQTRTPAPSETSPVPEATILPLTDTPEVNLDYQDETYCTIDGVALLFDLSYPENRGADPLPLVVYVHGGAWRPLPQPGQARSSGGTPF